MKEQPSFQGHFLCDIKLASANSHLLNFSYFSLMIQSLDFYNIFKLKI